MPAQQSPVTPSVLAWALAEDGRTLPELAEALRVDAHLVDEWVAGEALPSPGQVSTLARVLKRPRAMFFLPHPPVQATLPTSFRHPPGDEQRSVGVRARRRVRQARRVQQAMAWALRDEPATDLPRASTADPPEVAASAARDWLGVRVAEQQRWRDDYAAINAWRAALDAAGVLVFAMEIGRDDVRGFSAWDERAPLVVVNTTGISPAARVFTLAHELGHLVSRQDAACVDLAAPADSNRVERWCEQFGAALLMPRAPALSLARQRGIHPQTATLNDVKATAAAFRVSHRAAALRLIDLGLADRSLYAEVEAVFQAKRSAPAAAQVKRPPRAVARVREYGPRAIRTLLTSLPPRDALSVLRLTVEDVRRIADEVPGVPTP